MRIALVSANRETLPDPVVPLGLLYIAGATAAEHDVVLIDLCFAEAPLEYLAGRLREHAPDVIGVGLRNIQSADYGGTADCLAFFDSVVSTARSCSDAPVVLGGGGFSVLPRQLMERLGADYGIAGEGEHAWCLLLEALSGRGSIGDVPGLYHRCSGELRVTPPRARFSALDELSLPVRGLVDPRYYDEVGVENIQTKRGCPLLCSYCTYPTIEGRAIRKRAPGRVVDEIEAALARDERIDHIFIVDAQFNLPASHAKEICREMIARDVRPPWTCYATPLGFDRELAELMVEAGCAGAEIGSDSGCDQVLRRLHKSFSTAQIRQMHDICRRAGLRDAHTWILGTPGETLDHVRRSLEFIESLDAFCSILMAWVDDEEALDGELRASQQKFREQIFALLRERLPRAPRWVVPPLGVNFDRRLFRLLRRHELRGPLWQHIDLAARAHRASDPSGEAIPLPPA